MEWPCVAIRFGLQVQAGAKGEVIIVLRGKGSRFRATVTGPGGAVVHEETLQASGRSEHRIAYTFGDSGSELHTVVVRKLTEWQFEGETTTAFLGLSVSPSIQVVPDSSTTQRKRRIEFFGDSDTTGFGVQTKATWRDDFMCVWDQASVEDCGMDYSHVLAQSLSAEMQAQAISGIGVTRNVNLLGISPMGGPTPMPAYWNRTLQSDASAAMAWDFSRWVPDLVVVLIGPNDWDGYSQGPSKDLFAKAYSGMLLAIFQSYAHVSGPQPTVVAVCGGGNAPDEPNEKACPYVEAGVANARSSAPAFAPHLHYIKVPMKLLEEKDWGCIDHRNVHGQAKYAKFLEPRLREIMHWQDESGPSGEPQTT